MRTSIVATAAVFTLMTRGGISSDAAPDTLRRRPFLRHSRHGAG